MHSNQIGMKGRYVIVDFETTGLDATVHSPIQIGVLIVEDGHVLHSYERNIRNENPVISEQAMKVNNLTINPADALDHRAIQIQLRELMRRYFDEPVLLVGHNIPFDVSFLRVLFKGSTTPYEELFSHRTIDTSVLYQFHHRLGHLPKGGSLHQVAHSLGVAVDDSFRHTALGDCLLTLDVMNAFAMNASLNVPVATEEVREKPYV